MTVHKLKRINEPAKKQRRYTAVDRAIGIVGGLSLLAQAISEKSGRDIRKQHVCNWRVRGRIPRWALRTVRDITGIKIEDLI